MKKINVDNKYNIFLEENLHYKIPETVKKKYPLSKVFMITDDIVYNLYGENLFELLKSSGIILGKIIFQNGEKIKSLDNLFLIYDKLIDFNMNRNDIILAIGGGVIGDMSGFIASTYMRGIKFINVPTTLLSIVDSSVGGKTAINHEKGKNIIGTFYDPDEVFIDINYLNTLPEREYDSGMAEIIKYSLIADEKLFESLNSIVDIEKIIERCLEIKRDVVTKDRKEKNLRKILNFGHTIGHALEAITKYSYYTHGEAISIGMHEITKIFEKKGLTENGTSEKIKNLLMKYNLPFSIEDKYKKDLINYIKHDKKTVSDKIDLVYIPKIGKSEIIREDFDIFNEIFY